MKNMSLNLHTNSYEKYESQSIHTQILIKDMSINFQIKYAGKILV